MKRKKVLIAVILCFLIGNICQGRVELNFSEILFFCVAFRDISGQSRVPEIPRAFCALTSETRKQWRIEARIRLQYWLWTWNGLLFQTFRPKKVFKALEKENAKMNRIFGRRSCKNNFLPSDSVTLHNLQQRESRFP